MNERLIRVGVDVDSVLTSNAITAKASLRRRSVDELVVVQNTRYIEIVVK